MNRRPAAPRPIAGPTPSSRKRAIGYTRVSTGEQELSPEEQRRKIESWAAEHDVELVDVVGDMLTGKVKKSKETKLWMEDGWAYWGLSFHKLPQLERAVRRVRAGEADIFVANKRDRLFRQHAAMLMLEEVLLPGELATVQFDVRKMGPHGRVVAAVTDHTAEWEVNEISSRTKDNLAEAKAQGRRTGGVPFGKRDPEAHLRPGARDPERLLVEVPDEQATIAMIVKLTSKEGLGPQAICTRLAALKRTPRGKQWHPNTVRRILREQQQQGQTR